MIGLAGSLALDNNLIVKTEIFWFWQCESTGAQESKLKCLRIITTSCYPFIQRSAPIPNPRFYTSLKASRGIQDVAATSGGQENWTDERSDLWRSLGTCLLLGELEQDVYVVSHVARAVCAILIVFSANVACTRDIFSPNTMRRYPSRSPLMSKLFRTLSRYLPALGGTPRLSGVVQPAFSSFVLQRGRSCSTKP
jgi:hypothetical protein